MTARDVGSWFRKALSIQVLIAFILGLVVGLVVLGWWAWPVQWTNADPSDLRLSHKDAYLQLVAESYALSGNSEFARARLEALKKPEEQDVDLSAMIEAAAQIRGEAGKAEDAIRLRRLVTTLNLPVAGTTPQPTARPTSQATSGGTSGVARTLGVLFFLALLAAGIMVLFTQLQKREPRRRRPSPAPPEPLPPEEEPHVQALPADGARLAQFESQYKAGDEAYDVSFGLETASEEFLGECGISALDRTLGEPMILNSCGAVSAAIGDINGDGWDDLVERAYWNKKAREQFDKRRTRRDRTRRR